MNTDIQLAAEGAPEAVETGFSQAVDFIQAAERRFTRFSDSSELTELNRSGGNWFAASPEMFELVSAAQRLHLQTGGLFDPAILNALESAGYDRSFDQLPLRRTAAVPAPVRPNLYTFSQVRLDSLHRRIWLPPDLRIDLGGIAKGWIAERAARLLSAWAGACMVNAGGDAFVIGLPAGQPYWCFTVEDPTNPDGDIAALKVHPGAIVTSTITRRRWQQAGRFQHHLIDPRTSLPAETDWLSVTVLAPHAAEAEVYAKSILIAGSAQATQVAATAADPIEFIAVDRNKKLWGSHHSPEVLDV